MTSRPRVSIVIPCFDDADTIAGAVRSATTQPETEVVVVDDGSTDPQTLVQLEEVRAAGVPVLRQANAGSAAARMAGVMATSAPYVQPLDADDRLVDGASEALANYLDANPRVAAVWGNQQLTGERSHVRMTTPTLDPWLVTFVNGQLGPGSMVRRSALLEIGGWRAPDPSEPSCYWDWDFWMSLAERGYLGVNVGRIVLEYRIRSGSVNRRCLATHAELYDRLRLLHGELFAARRPNREGSIVPLAGQLAIRMIEVVPWLSRRTRTFLQEAVCKVAFHRGGYVRSVKWVLRSRRSERTTTPVG